jgi:TPR repeat protein
VLRCDDSEIDLRVDRQNCRALGIRSILAAPIRVGDKIEGLLEVFSPQPHAFHASDNSVLHRAAEIAGAFLDRARTAEISPEEQTLEVPQAGEEEDLYMPLAAEPDQRPEALSRSRRILLAAVTLTLLFVAAWLIFGWEGSRLSRLRPQPVTVNAPATATVATVGGFDGLRTLAEHGDAAAQFAVGVHYATGEDVPQDYSEAARWFSLAANQGQVMAQATLAAYYWAGRGIPQDLHKAYFWAVLAQAGGDEASKVRTSFLASRMTHADVVAAQQEADDWIKQHRAQADTSSE